MHGRGVAHRLAEVRIQEGVVGLEPGDQLGLLEHVPPHVSHGLVRRFSAAREEKRDKGLERRVGNPFADESRGQVVAEVAAPHFEERRHVLLVLGAGLQGDGAGVVGPAHPHHELAVPALEQGEVLHGQA